jgi:hypothetical protein
VISLRTAAPFTAGEGAVRGTAGTLEEKVFQRQLSKEGLSNVVNQSGKSAASLMSSEDLADLFTPEFNSRSSTFESMVAATDRETQPSDNIGPSAAASLDAPPVLREQVSLTLHRIQRLCDDSS